MPDQLNANHIGGQNGNYEPQRGNNALLHILGLTGADLLTLSLKTFPLPKQHNDPFEINYLNERRKFAGSAVCDDLEVTFNDWVDKGTALTLWSWRYQVYNPETGKIGLARNYKKQGLVELFAPDGTFIRTYDLIGLWPSNLDPGDSDMAAEEGLILSCTMAIDKAIPRNGVHPGGSANGGGAETSYSNVVNQAMGFSGR